MAYYLNTPPLVPLRARVERLTTGPAGQVRGGEREKQSAARLHRSSRRRGGLLGLIQRERTREEVEAHLPIHVE